MKVFISCDMEGITGTFSWKDYEANLKEYRKMMTAEVLAVIQGIRGARRRVNAIVVNDAHGWGDNIIAEDLPAQVSLVRGGPRPLGMMEGIDRSFDVAFFVGYHGGAGTEASVMDHTYASSSIYRIVVNGLPMSEAGINGAIAAEFGVPVGLVSGDTATIRQARRLFGPRAEYIAAKKSLSRFATQARSFLTVRQELADKAARVLGRLGDLKPLRLRAPRRVIVDLVDTLRADLVTVSREFRRTAGRQVLFSAPNYIEFHRKLRLLLALAARAKDYL